MPKGGFRPGAGRKKGKKLPATLEREAVQKAVDLQIMLSAADIIRAQKLVAMGSNYVYRIDEEEDSKGRVTSRKHVRVTDPDEIAIALDSIEAGGNSPDDKYYYATAIAPDPRAGDMLLNRALGKAKESLVLSNPDGNLKTIIINKAAKK